MSNFEQFLGGGEKIGEVVPMVSSEMPITFTAGGGSYLRSGYATLNSGGLFNTYRDLVYADTIVQTSNGTIAVSYFNVLKSGSNYINGKHYTTDLTSTWTTSTGGAITNNIMSIFIVGTTVVCTTTDTAIGMLDYSTDDGETWTNEVGFNYIGYGAANAAGTLAMVISAGGGTTAGSIYTSTDGVTWTSRTPSADVGGVNSVIWSPLLSAFVVKGGNGVFSTTDGYTLTLLSTPSTLYTRIVSSATSLVAVRPNTSYFMRSVDGITWTSASVPFITGFTLYPISSIIYVDSKYIATGANGVLFISTDDGLTWERVFAAFDTTYSTNNTPTVGMLDSSLYLTIGTEIKTVASLVPNGVMAKVKAEPTEGYAYVRVG